MNILHYLNQLDYPTKKSKVKLILSHLASIDDPKRKDLNVSNLQHKRFHMQYRRAKKRLLDHIKWTDCQLKLLNLEYLSSVAYLEGGNIIYYKIDYVLLINVFRRLIKQDSKLVKLL